MITYSIIQKSQLEGALRIDSEYYQLEYLDLVKSLINTKSYKQWSDINGRFITGPFGSEFNVENYTDDAGYRYVRGKDVKEFFLLDNDNVHIPQKDFERLKKYSLQEGDILVSVVGTLGNTSIVDKSAIPAIFSCKSTVFRANAINPFYFIAYLNCKYGKNLLRRSVRGHVQTGLNIEDLRSLLVYIPENQDKIASIILEARQSLEDSKQFYSQAENLLLEELGLKNAVFEDELSYIVNYSDAILDNRIDPEYFQPKYQKLIEKFKNKNAKQLGELISMRKGFEPGSEAYQEEGKLFIRVGSVSKLGIEEKDQKYLSEELYQALKKDYEPKLGDILLTKDATPGIAYVIKEPFEGIISGGILDLKVKDNIESEYLALCISSIVGQWQAQRDAGGSIIAHWKPEQIKSLVIPILPTEKQKEIAELVKKSHEARKKSKELLEQAKRKVEEMIDSTSPSTMNSGHNGSLQVEKGE